ncbi:MULTISPECIES: MFS transporter [Deinococcus]|uniref:Major facilitator superfamily MFS_1 n=1 Tax=Deinococcus geothermalis (strain DSM 11300 / CIP 105573 / AG-3a) TaxID=319795 RepID=Q1IZY1_DEIGD|nr:MULTISPECIES: MFS transporter [Deinococcus]ABF45203.1 major facilitator superfamily MFS_1 [Deinococcus geothermalis DSM 11300]MBI0444485.1 MFS transporter [Deinococcus sp. DB0503]
MTAVPAPPRLSAGLLASGAAAFFTLGVLQAMYGAAFPLFQARYGVGAAVVGWVASAHFLGSAVAPPVAGVALTRCSVRTVVLAAVLVLAAGVSVVALAPTWLLAVAGALVGGLGLGGVSAALNAAYASIGTRAVNLVNAVFGVGSVLSPLLVAALGSASLAWPFLVVAVLSLGTLGVVRMWNVPDLRPPEWSGEATRPGVRLALFALLIGLYVGLEVGFGAWLARPLEALTTARPALVLSGYWAGLTAGRVLTGLLGGRFAPSRLVLGAAVLTTLAAFAATQPVLAPGAYVLAGLTLSPIFGTTLAWVARSLPARRVPYLLVAGSLGGVLAPAALGLLYAHWGPGAVPLALAALGLALTGVVAVTARVTRVRSVSR